MREFGIFEIYPSNTCDCWSYGRSPRVRGSLCFCTAPRKQTFRKVHSGIESVRGHIPIFYSLRLTGTCLCVGIHTIHSPCPLSHNVILRTDLPRFSCMHCSTALYESVNISSVHKQHRRLISWDGCGLNSWYVCRSNRALL